MCAHSHLEIQRAFTRYLRDPDHCPAPPDVETRRMRIYQRLFYQNIESFMRGSYPVLQRVLGQTRWHALVRNYFHHHQARTPYFPQLAGEFLRYLEQDYRPEPEDPPFLVELARFEWAQIALNFDPREAAPRQVDTHGDVLKAPPLPNPVSLRLSFSFPVHRICASFQPTAASPATIYLWLFRRPDGKVRFLELNQVGARLVDLMDERPTDDAHTLLQAIATELRHPQPQKVLESGTAWLIRMRRTQALLGTRPLPAAH